ncbi:hypothetical protein IFM5058_07939 [Aspergillus udagawae]|nr:hypothetical protein IFM5058_07939 [Aspergillus udagawae]
MPQSSVLSRGAGGRPESVGRRACQSEEVQRPKVYLEMGDLNGEIWAEIMSASQSTDPPWDLAGEEACRLFIKPEALEKPPSETPYMPNNLPAFIKPVPNTRPPATHEFLLLNGALTLPSIPLQNALLEAFLEYVFPYAPLVEWQSLVATLADRQGRNGQVSLLLFNAIMLSAIQYVGLEHLLRAGYQSRQEGYSLFAQNTKLLYESGYETDDLTVLQALLLVAQCCESFSGARDGAGAAMLFAWQLRWVYLKLAQRFRLPPITKSFARDWHGVDDFDISFGPLSAAELPLDCVFVRDVDVQRTAATLCVSLAQLCNGIIRHPSRLARLQATTKALALWRDRLPPVCQFASLKSVDNIQTKSLMYPSIVAQKCSLEMVYFSAVAVLHQPEIFSSVARTRHAALQITQIASELRERGLQQLIPVTGATAILIAMIVHITDLRRTDPTVRHEAIKGVQSCQKTMVGLEEVYPAVRTASPLTYVHSGTRFPSRRSGPT